MNSSGQTEHTGCCLYLLRCPRQKYRWMVERVEGVWGKAILFMMGEDVLRKTYWWCSAGGWWCATVKGVKTQTGLGMVDEALWGREKQERVDGGWWEFLPIQQVPVPRIDRISALCSNCSWKPFSPSRGSALAHTSSRGSALVHTSSQGSALAHTSTPDPLHTSLFWSWSSLSRCC